MWQIQKNPPKNLHVIWILILPVLMKKIPEFLVQMVLLERLSVSEEQLLSPD